ncbi:uncharacterized protein [Diadema setosum]|uniref:uncharacterized protein n=1 Tax=Diadema setosum TaxID=31175 RepID=UPI003B3A14A0
MGQSGSHFGTLAKKKKRKADAKSKEREDAGTGGSSPRLVMRRFGSVATDAGLGAKVQRSIGCDEMEYFDPFLLLDEITVRKPAGFPDHPHRGVDIVSYVLQGCTEYQDFLGNEGSIEEGGIQLLTAGRGIVHCEMPSGEDVCHSLELWVNLSPAEKMTEPAYQDSRKEDIPCVTDGGARVKVIAGEYLDKKSCIKTHTPTIFLDVELDERGTLSQPLPQGWNAFIYVLSGKASFGPPKQQTEGTEREILLLTDGQHIEATNKNAEVCRFVLVAGQPLNDPVAREGNFVMTTLEEVEEAVKDHRFGRNGFEKAPDWNTQSGLDYLDSQF